MCVWSGGSSSDSTTIKEDIFCNFDLTYFPCRLHPPDIPCEEGSLLESPGTPLRAGQLRNRDIIALLHCLWAAKHFTLYLE